MSATRHFVGATACVACLSVLLAGCGSADEPAPGDGATAVDGQGSGDEVAVDASATGGPTQGYATPEECFEGAKTAVAGKDMGGFFDTLTPISQDQMAGSMVMIGSMMQMMSGMAAMGGPEAKAEAEKQVAAINAVLEKHGVTEESLEKAAPGPETATDPKAMAKLADVVEDKRAFVADIFAALETMGQGGPNLDEKMVGELKDVKIEGDRATATLAGPDGEQEIDFRKIDGGWKLHFDAEKMAAPAGDEGMPSPEGFEESDFESSEEIDLSAEPAEAEAN